MSWKSNSKLVPGSVKPVPPVYGAQYPPHDVTTFNKQKSRSKSGTTKDSSAGIHHGGRNSFRTFQDDTSDAWDIDDVMPSSSAVELSLSLHDVERAQRTALEVIQSHREQTAAGRRLASAGEGALSAPSNSSTLAAAAATTDRSQAAQAPNRLQQGSSPASFTNISSSPFSPGGLSSSSFTARSSTTSSTKSGFSSTTTTTTAAPVVGLQASREAAKLARFDGVLAASTVNMEELRRLSWSGVPRLRRPIVWKLLCGYLPPTADRQAAVLQQKRSDYRSLVDQYLEPRYLQLHKETHRQIHIDIPRMNPKVKLFQQQVVQEMFERILFIWAVRHPASGYVQGMNDLVTPFFVAFLADYTTENVIAPSTNTRSSATSASSSSTFSNPITTTHTPSGHYFDVETTLGEQERAALEADCFWCLSKLMDGIQDNYTFAQPGIQRQVKQLEALMERIDAPLHQHIRDFNIEYLQFSFRWMNNLLMREFPMRSVLRLWDTYQAEKDGFSELHLYVCVAFLEHFRRELLDKHNFQDLMVELQALRTDAWDADEVDLLLAEAYRLKFTYHGLRSISGGGGGFGGAGTGGAVATASSTNAGVHTSQTVSAPTADTSR